jgi:hypothetical protein
VGRVQSVVVIGFVVRLAAIAVAAWVLYRATDTGMEWLAVVAFIGLLLALVPSFLADLVNRLRPFGSANSRPREPPWRRNPWPRRRGGPVRNPPNWR